VRGLLPAVLLAGSLALGPAARAQESSGWRSWYGWQLMLADAAAVGLALAPVDLDWRGATVTMGMTGLFINGAVVNMVHDNAPAATRSLLRLPAFLFGRLLGFGAAELFCREAGCKAPLQTAGGYFGLATVMLLDLMDAFEPTPWWLPEIERPPPPPPGTSPLARERRQGLAAPALVFTIVGGAF
jgi:hypothetical protein